MKKRRLVNPTMLTIKGDPGEFSNITIELMDGDMVWMEQDIDLYGTQTIAFSYKQIHEVIKALLEMNVLASIAGSDAETH